MAFKLIDRGWQETVSIGTGNIVLGDVLPTYQAFNQPEIVIGVDTFPYTIVHRTNPAAWEVGHGRLIDGTTIERVIVFTSSNANTLVDFPVGEKDIFCSPNAAWVSTLATSASVSAAIAAALSSYSTLSNVTAQISSAFASPPALGSLAPAAVNGTTGTFSGNLVVDTNTLSVIAATNRVGILTASPGVDLDVSSSIDDLISIRAKNTSTGISASAAIFAENSASSVQLAKISTGASAYKTAIANAAVLYNTGGNLVFLNDDAAGDISFLAGGAASPQITILPAGFVGIGRVAPAYKLDISNDHTPILRLSSTTLADATMDWYMTIGAPGTGNQFTNGNLAISRNTPSGSNWEMQFAGLGVVKARTSFSAPGFSSVVTGVGDANLIDWTSTGGNFNGYAAVGVRHGNAGTLGSDLRLYMGTNAASKIDFRDWSDTVYMTLLKSGKVGIGTAIPTRLFEVLSTTAPQARISYSDTRYLDVSVSSAGTATFAINQPNDGTASWIFDSFHNQSGNIFEVKTNGGTRLKLTDDTLSVPTNIRTHTDGLPMIFRGASEDIIFRAELTGVQFRNSSNVTISRIATMASYHSYFGIGNTGFGAGFASQGASAPTALIDVNGDLIRLRTAKTPASTSAAGNRGDFGFDANYFYGCVATNTWGRIAWSFGW